VYLTKVERVTLRLATGKGAGAFTIDPTPVDAMDCYRDPLEPFDVDTAEEWQLDFPVE
jgi:hypothetical protein